MIAVGSKAPVRAQVRSFRTSLERRINPSKLRLALERFFLCYFLIVLIILKLIRGWDEALLTMSVGEKATVTIEPEWAYGAKGLKEGGIGPNETLIFEIELLKIF